jgi:hypothetical protein
MVQMVLPTGTFAEFGIPNPQEIIKHIRGPSADNVLHPIKIIQNFSFFLNP